MQFHISNYNNGRKLNLVDKFKILDLLHTLQNKNSESTCKAHISKSHDVRKCHCVLVSKTKS